MAAEETKVIYHIDDEDTPYLVKLPVGPDRVTLADFKNVLNRPNYKFFFKVIARSDNLCAYNHPCSPWTMTLAW